MRTTLSRALCVGLAALSLASVSACERRRPPMPLLTVTTATPTATAVLVPLTNEPVAVLPEVQINDNKMVLGRRLFHDNRLSGDSTLSCATCHSLDHGGAEARRTSTGIRGQTGPINAPTVLNAGLNFVQFWDGRAANLQAQAAGPVTNPIEMGAQWPEVIERLRADAAYLAAFTALYPDGITQANVTDAIAEYERSLRTPSRFDRYLLGDATVLRDSERRGYETFKSVGCPTCHSGPGFGGATFQRMGERRNYFGERGSPLTDADNGRFSVTHDENDRHRFKVPLLRNVALTAPYLHDGSQATLEDVVRTMGRYQLGIELTSAQIEDLVAFLRSLTGDLPATAREPQTASAAPSAPAPAPGATAAH